MDASIHNYMMYRSDKNVNVSRDQMYSGITLIYDFGKRNGILW